MADWQGEAGGMMMASDRWRQRQQLTDDSEEQAGDS